MGTGTYALMLAGVIVALLSAQGVKARKTVVAHRGASAYAPEHTLASYRLALTQGADYVEQDLAVTSDGVLICLHDETLERTTNVEHVFPDRRPWLANDFTLAEIKRLDAGSWFDPKFAGERVPTFQEAIDLVKGQAGIYPELKAPELYASRHIEFETMVAGILAKNGLLGADAEPNTPVILQTFSESSLEKLVALELGLPMVLLLEARDADQWGSRERVIAAKAAGATGLGPAKTIIDRHPNLVTWAHELGLTVTPYTFRSSSTGRFPSVRDEMTYFLYERDVDALFTDNPDQFPRR